MFRLGRLACLLDDGLGGGDRLLGLLLLDFGRDGAGFLDHLAGLLAGLHHELVRLGLSAGQLLLDLLRILEAFLNASLALFEHG